MTDITWQPVTVALADLTPWERNPKRISKTHAKRLLELWKEIGQFQTIAIGPNGEVYDGHQRLSVLKAAHGKSYEVIALQSSQALTEKQREKLTIEAHTGTTGQFDWDALAGWDAAELQAWGFDAELLQDWNTGAAALATMLEAEQPAPADDPGAQIDKAAELRERWGVETGQLWQLGEHRLICGDCTDAAVVARVMGGEQLDLVVTDPPYAVDYAAKNRALQTIGRSNRLTTDIQGDTLDTEETAKTIWEPAFANAYEVSRNGAVIYCFAPQGGDQMMMMMMMMLRAKWNDRLHQLIWRKNAPTFSMGRLDYSYQHEPILYSWRGTNHGFYGDGARSIIDCDRPSASKLHPTMKPVELIEILVRNSSRSGEIVYDPFLGSGTTLIACERLGRRCRAVEIEPSYVAVAIQRWVDMTGGEPVLVDNGRQ